MTNKKFWFGMMAFCTAGLLIASCGISKKDLTEQVKAAIEEQWEEQGLDFEIKDLSLIKLNNKEYRGILEAESYGESVNLTVLVTVDGDTFMWELE
jgi:hypothetical protein